MAEHEQQTLIVGAGESARVIAYRSSPDSGSAAPGVFWLSGFMSDMGSTKATALAAWAQERGQSATLFDYSGHGASSGRFVDGTIGRWLEEAVAVFKHATQGQQIVVGSSMGGYIALLLLRHFLRNDPEAARRIKALVLIAPAWDMTEELMWKKFGANERREIETRGFYERPSAYDAPYTITRSLIEDGRAHLLARQPFDPGRPIVIIQGKLDEDVPAQHTRELASFLTGGHVKLIEVADAGHRLSRPQDIKRLFSEIEGLT